MYIIKNHLYLLVLGCITELFVLLISNVHTYAVLIARMTCAYT